MTSHLWVLIFWTPYSLFLLFWSYLLDFLWAIILQKLLRGKWQKKWGEFGIGAFEEIVISSLWDEKNICSCQKNIAVIKIKCPSWLMVCVEWQYYIFLLSSDFFCCCSLWQWSFKRGKCSCDTIGTIIKYNKVTVFILGGVICLTFSGMIVTYACVQNTHLATIVL